MPTVQTGLQPNHSEWMRLVATLSDEQSTQPVYAEFVRHLKELFDRAERFTCAGFGRSLKTKAEFAQVAAMIVRELINVSITRVKSRGWMLQEENRI